MEKNTKIILGTLAAVLVIFLALWISSNKDTPTPEPEPPVIQEPTPIPPIEESNEQVIGTSVEGRPILSYAYGTGSTTLLFVGGMHGGYEWNSVLLAYEFIDQLENKTMSVPEEIRVVVIPSLNPDGLYSVVGKEGRFTIGEIPPNDAHTTGQGRFNARNVDLNRNFACKWQPESSWRGKKVAAGTAPFSEPEAVALRDVVKNITPSAVVFWHSQANTVYASECEAGVLPKTLEMMSGYAKAGQYKEVATFDAYPVTGDAEGWLASINIPAITVELETRTSPEWERNKAGIEALFTLFK